MLYNKIPKTGNPSAEIQKFSKFKINLLCSHYWTIEAWEHANLSFPYWRLYWNNTTGAEIEFQSHIYKISPDYIFLIPPNTSFSTFYDPYNKSEPDKDLFIGTPCSMVKSSDKNIKHLFMHFTLGLPYDSITPQIFSIKISPYLDNLLHCLTSELTDDQVNFTNKVNLGFYNLITTLLWQIPNEKWIFQTTDKRIDTVVKYIDSHITKNISNEILGSIINMSPNSFLRLFRQEIKISPQKYILKRKIEKASVMLHYSNYSIDEIAQKTGFNDRFYFSRVFKKIMHISPAAYRKNFRF